MVGRDHELNSENTFKISERDGWDVVKLAQKRGLYRTFTLRSWKFGGIACHQK